MAETTKLSVGKVLDKLRKADAPKTCHVRHCEHESIHVKGLFGCLYCDYHLKALRCPL